MEKAVCAGLHVLGVTIFSIVMNSFINIMMTLFDNQSKDQQDDLHSWFALLKKVRNQPFGDGKDISITLKKDIEKHFLYFWDHDRTHVLRDKLEYFEAIPFWIKEKIMCDFMF